MSTYRFVVGKGRLHSSLAGSDMLAIEVEVEGYENMLRAVQDALMDVKRARAQGVEGLALFSTFGQLERLDETDYQEDYRHKGWG